MRAAEATPITPSNTRCFGWACNLARDRDLLELAKAEATRFVEGPRDDIPREEIETVRSCLKHQMQRRYGLVEA